MSAPDRERLSELASLHALGVLTAAERDELARAARTDPALAAEVRALERTVAALGGVVPQVDPPAGLRDRVLASVSGRPAPAPVPSAPAPAPAGRVAVGPWLAAAAALVAAAGLGLWALDLRERLAEMDARVAAAEREVVGLRRALGDAQSRTQMLQAQASVLVAPDLARVDLAGQPAAPQASARAFWSRRSGMVFAASALPPLPADRTYQVWVLVDARPPVSAGLLHPDREGNTTVHFTTPPDIPAPVAVAVTLEPAGGVPQPTGDKVLVGRVGD